MSKMIYGKSYGNKTGFVKEKRNNNLPGIITGIITATFIGLSSLLILLPKTVLTNYFMRYFRFFGKVSPNSFTLANRVTYITNTGLLIFLIPIFTNLSRRKLRLIKSNLKIYILILIIVTVFGIVDISAILRQVVNQPAAVDTNLKTIFSIFYLISIFNGIVNVAELMVMETAFLKMTDVYVRFSGEMGILPTLYFITVMIFVNTFNRIVYYLFILVRLEEIQKQHIYNWSQKLKFFKFYICNNVVYEKLLNDNSFILSTSVIIISGILVFLKLYIKNKRRFRY